MPITCLAKVAMDPKYHVCWPRLTAKRVEPVVSISWASCFVCHATSPLLTYLPCVRGVHSSNKHCVAVYCPISMQFAEFFHRWFLFQAHYIVLIFVARWRRNFHEIAVKNCEKSQNRRKTLCAPLRIDSWSIWEKFHRSSLGGNMYMCTYIKNFAHVDTWRWQQVSKFV